MQQDINCKSHNPITNKDQDLLDLNNYVQGVCSKINQIFNDKTNASIGIIGRWGDGKTSVINLCLESLKSIYEITNKINYKNLIFYIGTVLFSCLALYILNDVIIDKICTFAKYMIDNILVGLLIIYFLFAVVVLNLGRFKNFLNIIVYKFDKYIHYRQDSLMVINFSPWDCSDTKQMYKEYLKLLSKKLGIYFPEISNLILEYSKLVTNIDFQKVLNIHLNDNISMLKEEITKKLNDEDQKIIVVIDDFDRILGADIFNLLKLIGTIANFPNLINLVAYDKEYICSNLDKYIKDKGICDSDKYINKIIQYEFPLPKINQIKLYSLFVQELDKVVKPVKYNIEDLQTYYSNTIGGYITNIRDIKTLINAFKFHYDIFKNNNININVVELLFLTAIKVFNIKLWNYIYENGKNYHMTGVGMPNGLIERDNSYIPEFIKNLFKEKVLKTYEYNILGSLIPSLKNSEDIKIFCINDRYKYDLKRFWSGASAFNLYFEFNPPKSQIDNIIRSIMKEKFNIKSFVSLMNSDVDWSDLNDFICSEQYKNDRNEIAISNVIKLILLTKYKRETIVNYRYNYYQLLKSIDIDNFTEQILSCMDSNNLNINSLIEMLYMYFLYNENSATHKISDIKKLNQEEEQYFNKISIKVKEILNKIELNDLAIISYYYVGAGFCEQDNEFKQILQSRIYDYCDKYEEYDLLTLLQHLMFENSPGFYSSEIISDESNLFTSKAKEILKNKLEKLKENQTIMQNPNLYYNIHNVSTFNFEDIKPQHIINYFLNSLS